MAPFLFLEIIASSHRARFDLRQPREDTTALAHACRSADRSDCRLRPAPPCRKVRGWSGAAAAAGQISDPAILDRYIRIGAKKHPFPQNVFYQFVRGHFRVKGVGFWLCRSMKARISASSWGFVIANATSVTERPSSCGAGFFLFGVIAWRRRRATGSIAAGRRESSTLSHPHDQDYGARSSHNGSTGAERLL